MESFYANLESRNTWQNHYKKILFLEFLTKDLRKYRELVSSIEDVFFLI